MMREPAHRKYSGELRRATISLRAALVTIYERFEAQSRKNGSDTVKQPCRFFMRRFHHDAVANNGTEIGRNRKNMMDDIKKGGQTTKPLSRPDRSNKTRPAQKGRVRNGTSYEPLARKFRAGGFDYNQIARERHFAIYEQRWQDGGNVCYEVVRIQRCEAQTLFGRQYPAREVYPSSEHWGQQGWTVLTKDAAFDKLAALRGQP